MFLAHVLDTKVIDYEGEHDGSPFVVPRAWRGIKLVVACIVEAFFKAFVGKNARLRKDVDVFDDLEVYPTFSHMVGQGVFDGEFLGDVIEADSDIFRAVKRCANVEVANVEGAEFFIFA